MGTGARIQKIAHTHKWRAQVEVVITMTILNSRPLSLHQKIDSIAKHVINMFAYHQYLK